jgi:phosphoglycolate phosphatase-like HAD superfamily hydrolase
VLRYFWNGGETLVRAIAFDFDGVLVESVEVKTKAFARLFAGEDLMILQQIIAYHLKNLGVSRFEKFRTIYRDILKRPLFEEQFRSICEQFSELVVDEVVAAPWVDGAEKWLIRHQGQYPLFVVSGTPQDELQEIVGRRGMAKFFDGVLGAPRTKDLLLRDALQRDGLSPTELVFVGDAATDWQAACQAGVWFIWRKSSEKMPSLPGFTGPSIPSLTDLDACLSALEHQKALKG